jgi:hypothetical protein
MRNKKLLIVFVLLYQTLAAQKFQPTFSSLEQANPVP